MRHKITRRNCLNCGLLLNRPEKFYCTNKCQRLLEWNQRKIIIDTEGCFPSSSKVTRRYLIEKHGNVCSICKSINWFGESIPLVLDHIDGNSDNWLVENCRMICPNCDTFTPFYKGKNKGNGRFSRRQRYLKGLSY